MGKYQCKRCEEYTIVKTDCISCLGCGDADWQPVKKKSKEAKLYGTSLVQHARELAIDTEIKEAIAAIGSYTFSKELHLREVLTLLHKKTMGG